MPEHTDKENHNNFWAGLVVGGLIGAVAAYFLSSEDKEKLRKEIARKGKLLLNNLEEVGEKAMEKGEELKERVTDEVQVVSKKVKKLPEIAQKAVETAQDNFGSTKKSIKKVFLKKGKPLTK